MSTSHLGLSSSLALLSILVSSAPTGERIGYGLEGGETLRRTFEADASYERTSISIVVDGEEFSDMEVPELSMDSLERVVAVDRVTEAEDGRPTDFRRVFEELHQETSYESGEDEAETSGGSDLEGIALRFLYDDADGTYYPELVDEEDEVEQDVLDWLDADMDLTGFLPTEEVEEGDTWDVEASAYLGLMWPGGLVGWYDEEHEDGPSEFEVEQDRARIENLEGSGTVTFRGVEEADGVRVAVLHVELELETESSGSPREDLEVSVAMQRSLEGELRWDLDHGHLHDAAFEAESAWSRTETFPVQDEEGATHEIEQTESQEGTITYRAAVERE